MSNEYDRVFVNVAMLPVVITFSFKDQLASGESLTGQTPTVTDVTDNWAATGDLTLTPVTVNTTADADGEFGVGEAVSFLFTTTDTDGEDYLLKIRCPKDTGDGQYVGDYLWVHVDRPCV